MIPSIINNFDLFVFDLDDTLIKTEKYHYEAWINTLKKYKSPDFFISTELFFSKFHSIKQDSIKTYLIDELKINNIETLINYKNNIYLEILNKNEDNIILINGAEDLIKNIIKYKKKFVIVSNSLKSNIDFFIELFPILKYSSKNYYREIIINKKPNPECYLRVIEDFPNLKAIGFEDSITGIHAITQVSEIKTIFINDSSYIHYDYILKNYPNIINIKDYNDLCNHLKE